MYLRILHVLPALDGGGVSQDTLALAEFLANEPIKVFVAGADGPLKNTTAWSNNLTFLPRNFRTKNPVRLFQNAFWLDQICRKHHVDIVHVHSRAPAISCWMAFNVLQPIRRLLRRKNSLKTTWLSTFHACYEHKNVFQRFYAGFMLWGAATISISRFIHAHIQKTYPAQTEKKLTCIPRGRDPHYFSPDNVDKKAVQALKINIYNTKKPPPLIFLCPGRPTPLKGQLLLLDAFAQLSAAETQKAYLVFLGLPAQHPYTKRVQNHARLMGLDKYVKVFEFTKDLRPFYAAADVVVVPSLRPEGFGLVLAEAALMEKPIITFNVGAAPELVIDQKTGWLLDSSPKNQPATNKTAANDLKNGLSDAIAFSNSQRQSFGYHGRQHVQKYYSQASTHKKTLQLYKRLALHLAE